MQRLTPYLFFIIAALALAMIALDPDDSWQTEEVDTLDAVLITVGVLVGAHALRRLGGWLYSRYKDRKN
jgi:hypothetical protein